MRRKYYDPCDTCYLIVNYDKRQFFRGDVFNAGCDTVPLTSWEGLVTGLLLCIPPVSVVPHAYVGAWVGERVVVLYAGADWGQYNRIIETFEEVTDAVLVMMATVREEWATELVCQSGPWYRENYYPLLEFAYLTYLTRSPLLWSALDASCGSEWPSRFLDSVREQGDWSPYKHVLDMDIQTPLLSGDVKPANHTLVQSPLALAINLTKEQYLDLQRLRIFYPEQHPVGLGLVGEAVAELIGIFNIVRRPHMRSAWLNDRIALAYVNSVPDAGGIATTTALHPDRNLYTLARETYHDITDEYLLSLLQETCYTREESIEAVTANPAMLVELGNLVFQYPQRAQILRADMDRILGDEWPKQYKAAKA